MGLTGMFRRLSRPARLVVIAGLCLVAEGAHAGSIIVLQPDGVDDRIAEGRDYATYELGNPWDMSESTDVATFWSGNITGETFSGGIYSGTTENDPGFYLKHPGVPSTVNLEKGIEHPIDSSIYRYFSTRIRFTAGANQPIQIFFFEEGGFAPGTFGLTDFAPVPPNVWTIVEIDLATFTHSSSPRTWTSMPLVAGLRVDAGAAAGVFFEIDWVRLTADPTLPAAKKLVQWSASGTGAATFSIEAIDSLGTVFELVSGLPAGTTSHLADLSALAPGDYDIRVRASSGESAVGSGPVSVNQAPLVNLLQPDVAGDDANDYATVELGNPWGPFDPADISTTGNITNLSYSDPPGTLSGDNTSGDPGIVFNTPALIDTDKYRMLSYQFELAYSDFGSVSRFFWGDRPPPNPIPDFTSDDILVPDGIVTYAVGDMNDVPIEGGTGGHWNGALTNFRFDPHESPAVRHFILHWVRLSPIDSATPLFSFEWSDFDPDDDASIDIWLDQDRDPTNGNEYRIAAGLSEDSPTDSRLWNATGFASGLYEVFTRVTDGLNSIDRYATGPLLLETPPPTGPVLAVAPDPIDFGGTSVGGSVVREVTLTNANLGPDAVVVSSTTVSDPTHYEVATGGSSPCASLTPTLASGASCSLEVTFSPLAVGRFDANLTVTSNSTVDPTRVVPMTGGGCSTTPDQVYSSETVTGTETREACSSITVGPAFEVATTGDLTLRAGHLVQLDPGFVAYGDFVAEIDPALAEN